MLILRSIVIWFWPEVSGINPSGLNWRNAIAWARAHHSPCHIVLRAGTLDQPTAMIRMHADGVRTAVCNINSTFFEFNLPKQKDKIIVCRQSACVFMHKEHKHLYINFYFAAIFRLWRLLIAPTCAAAYYDNYQRLIYLGDVGVHGGGEIYAYITAWVKTISTRALQPAEIVLDWMSVAVEALCWRWHHTKVP